MRLALTVFFLILNFASFIPAQNPPEPASANEYLTSGNPLVRAIEGGAAHDFAVRAAAGEAVRIRVEQRDADVSVAVYDSARPDEKLNEIDFSYGVIGTEELLFVAPQTGVFRVRVTSADKSAKSGSYQISLAEQRAANEKDRQENLARQKLFAGSNTSERGTAESFAQAARLFGEAAGISREIGDDRGAAQALHYKTLALFNIGERREALAAARAALDLWRKIGDRIYEAETLFNIAATELGVGEPQQSIADFTSAQAIFRELKIAAGEAKVLSQMAIVYSQLGNFRRAIELNEQAIPLNRSLNNLSEVAVSLNTLGTTYGYLGEPVKSAAYYEEALKIFREIGEARNVAGVLANLANGASDAGDFDKAFDYSARALEIHRQIGDRYTEAATLRNYGEFYRIAGDYERALQIERQALEISKAINRRDTEMTALNSIGNIYNALGDYEKAVENYRSSLALARAMQNESSIATQLNSIGYNLVLLERFDEALENLTPALELFTKNGYRQGVAQALLNIGFAHHRKGDAAKALENYRQLLTIAEQIENPRQEVNAHYLIALALRDRNEYPAALAAIENCVRVSEAMRASLSRADLRASFFAGHKKFYDLYVEILLRLSETAKATDYVSRALEIAERSKARTLVELLNQSGANVKAGAGKDLLRRESEVNSRLSAKAARQTRLLASGKAAPDELKALAGEISDLIDEREKTAAAIRRADPNYAALTNPAPVRAKDIQALLDADTVLLEYALGDRQSALWLVTGDSIEVFKLPKREEIEPAARRFYEALKQNGEPEPADRAALRDMLLEPVAEKLAGKRIVVVADGALQYIPFAALPNANRDKRFLIETNEIANLPSAGALAALRRETGKRKPASKAIAVFADPVFAASDPRVKNAPEAKKQTAFDARLQRSLEETFGAGGEEALKTIPRLPFSRREAEAILQNVAAPNQSLKAIDFAANATAASGENLSDYRVVHFATHGLLNSKNPELSGLVLSLVNEKGEPQNGFLRLSDVYGLRLNSDLVVLSACQTALGKDIRGEGLIGLTRGFMYAGSPRVVASLWKVDDAATAELMRRFYAALLQKKLPAAQALRAAQIEMSRDERYRSPYFWAAFTLQGEWR
jgi:CHAT domain-containing protein/tetratricopeptide (TPR) repeat protein